MSTSISTLLSTLKEPITHIQLDVLRQIYSSVDEFWNDLAPYIPQLEGFLAKNENFDEGPLINLILSKLHFHQRDLDRSFDCAVKSGSAFDLDDKSKHTTALIELTVERFVSHSKCVLGDKPSFLSPGVVAIMTRLLNHLIGKKHFIAALALSVDALSPNLFEDCLEGIFGDIELNSSTSSDAFLQQRALALAALKLPPRCPRPDLQKAFALALYSQCARNSLLRPLEFARLLLSHQLNLGISHLITALTLNLSVAPFLARCESALFDHRARPHNGIALAALSRSRKIGTNASRSTESLGVADMSQNDAVVAENECLALQVAFDVAESGDWALCRTLLANFVVPFYIDGETLALGDARAGLELVLGAIFEKKGSGSDRSEADNGQKRTDAPSPPAKNETADGGGEANTEPLAARRIQALISALHKARLEPPKSSDELVRHAALFSIENFIRSSAVRRVLSGRPGAFLKLQFLHGACRERAAVIGSILKTVGNKNPITSGALIVAHAFMRCGTARDGFARRNSAWFGELGRWTKFSAVAGLGVVHLGNTRGSEKLLAAFMPQGQGVKSPYSEGGALMALGMIHSRTGEDVVEVLRGSLGKAGDNVIVQHGGCLGLGICSVGKHDSQTTNLLMGVLGQDNPVSGQAAAIAIGLNNLGSLSSSLSAQLYDCATETTHEKISRALAMALALLGYRGEKSYSAVYNRMLKDESAVLRYGGCFAIGLAFVGTESAFAISTLQTVASTDVSGDVRRAAVMALIFVLCRVPSRITKLTRLFAESYSPHLRYGAAMAIGISLCGTADQRGLEILDPLLKDKAEYVRNAAVSAVSLLLSQAPAACADAVQEHWKRLSKTIRLSSSSDFPSFVKAGAIVGAGLLQLGDGCAAVSLVTAEGLLRPAAVAGVAVFLQSWYWWPYQHFLALAVEPSAFIGVTSELKLPRCYRLFCENARAFEVVEPKSDAAEKAEETSIKLSITDKRHICTGNKTPLLTPLRQRSMSLQHAPSHSVPNVPKPEKNDEKTDKNSEKNDEKMIKNPGKITEKIAEQIKSEKNDEKMDKKIEGKGRKSATKEEARLRLLERVVGRGRLLYNPSRVTAAQWESTAEIAGQRYRAAKKARGIVLLHDADPAAKECVAANRFIEEMCQ